MIRAHTILLKPTGRQEEHFRQCAGIARFSYNWALDRWKTRLDEGQSTSWQTLRKEFNHELKPEKEWLTEVNKCVPAMAISQVGEAMKNFFESCRGKRKGRKMAFPKFKSKHRSKDVFCIESDKVKVDSKEKKLWVPRLGWIDMAESLRFEGRIGNVRISRKADRWFVSIPVESEPEDPTETHRNAAVGIDFGLKTTLVQSDGKCLQGPRALQNALRKLKKASRRRARKVRGSANRRKAILKESRAHMRVSNVRNDWHHKTSRHLASSHKLIFLEDLNLPGMLKNHKLARHLSDNSFGELKRQITYKAEEEGGQCLTVSGWYPSSKTCRKCGYKKSELKLSERVYRCESQACSHVEDRDLNAARNILNEGLRLHRTKVSDEIGRAAPELTPVERRTSAKPSGRVSSLVEIGSTPVHRQNHSRNEERRSF